MPDLGGHDGARLDKLLAELAEQSQRQELQKRAYFEHLSRLQAELVTLQNWVQHQGLKIAVLFEGRDAAGKGGVIKRITQRLNPRICRAVALPPPNEQERGQWYFQRYVRHLPGRGEIVLFDRSWYNRAGVERVMGFCTDEEYEDFLAAAPLFERMLIASGIKLIKYWFSITYEEQYFRLMQRASNPLKRWKLSDMDIMSHKLWDQYTEAKNVMFQRTHSQQAPWWVIDAVDKRRARLNCIQHLLGQIPCRPVDEEAVPLPELDPSQAPPRLPPVSANIVQARF
jgi:polyphosphate kinase 2